jgi:hypothetical protein
MRHTILASMMLRIDLLSLVFVAEEYGARPGRRANFMSLRLR